MKKWLGLIISLIILFGCNPDEVVDIVAQVNEDTLSLDELKSPFSVEEWALKSTKEKKELAQDWINLTVLAQAADQRQISETSQLKFRIENSSKTIKANALIAQEFSEIKVTENDLFEYFKLHQNRYKTSYPEYKIQRIFTEDVETTNLVLEEIKNGLKFTDAAKQYSKEAAGDNGGYIGFVGEKDLDPLMWKKITELKEWRYDRVNTATGFYIVRHYQSKNVIIDKKFSEVKYEIKKEVLAEKRKSIYNKLVDKMRQQTENIKISI